MRNDDVQGAGGMNRAWALYGERARAEALLGVRAVGAGRSARSQADARETRLCWRKKVVATYQYVRLRVGAGSA